MWPIKNLVPLCCVLSIVFIQSIVMANPADANKMKLTRSIGQFSADLYQSAATGKGNVIMSPLSIQTALSLALMGAKGKTAEEMISTMKMSDLKDSEIADSFKSLMASIESNPSLKIANKIFVKNSFSVKKEFNDIATNSFRSEAENVDFGQNTMAAGKINSWVESKTNNKIQNLIDPSALNDDTRMVLVNAIYFKGFWTHKFPVTATMPAPFWVSSSESINVPMMNVKAKFRYGIVDDLNAVALELPYKDSDMSMLIILPNERDGLPQLEGSLANYDMSSISEKLYEQEVIVSLPKFKIEMEINLNKVLKKMGMSTMFTDAADFSGLLDSPQPLKVSEVVHKAFIEVNEEGAEAAAATALIMRTFAAIMTAEFIVDRPFYFALWDTKTKVPSFSGRIYKPEI